MTPREIVLQQIHHCPTETVPYHLPFEEEVASCLDQYYGGKPWREKLVPYIIFCGGIDRRKPEPINATPERDLFGSVWRIDKQAFHLEEPGLKRPSFDGYVFPFAEAFIDPQLKETAERIRQENPSSFTALWLGWGLWESYWGIRGSENALMDCVAEPDFFVELLDRLTDIYLAHVAHCADIPVDAIMLADDWCDQRGVTIGPERWRAFFKPRYAQIYEATHAQGKIAITAAAA